MSVTYGFAEFWTWIIAHPNCILRAGTPEMVFYDEEDFHWHFGEVEGTLVVQVMRGKRVLGELFVEPERGTYVQEVPQEVEGEHVFEVIAETASEQYPAYIFVLSHGFEPEDMVPRRRVH
jgi:hypothetical protein